MSEAYSDALQEQAKKDVWDTLAQEAANLPTIEKATLVADVAGIFDPSPACDTVGGLLSLAQGDFLGAGLSVLGYIPYVGDLGKIAKIGKRAPRTAKILEQILRRGDNLAKAGKETLEQVLHLSQVAAARRKALARFSRPCSTHATSYRGVRIARSWSAPTAESVSCRCRNPEMEADG